MITGELDPLRDEGELYAERLRQAGVAVRSFRYSGHLHATMALTGLHDSARQYLRDVTEALDEFRAAAVP